MALSKFHKVDVALWGEISETLKLLEAQTFGKTKTLNQRNEIAKRWTIWKEEKESQKEKQELDRIQVVARA